MRTYQVVTSNYDRASTSASDPKFQTFTDGLEGIKLALRNRAVDKCIIFRPLFNETEPTTGRRFFREWRSFDGGSFKECRWDF